MRNIIGAVIGMILFVGTPSAKALPPSDWGTTQSLLDDCKSGDRTRLASCKEYLNGIADMMLVVSVALQSPRSSPSDKRALLPFAMCRSAAMSGEQFRHLLVNWAENNRAAARLPRSVAAWTSLQAKWPCPPVSN
jgi:hypothetical protein